MSGQVASIQGQLPGQQSATRSSLRGVCREQRQTGTYATDGVHTSQTVCVHVNATCSLNTVWRILHSSVLLIAYTYISTQSYIFNPRHPHAHLPHPHTHPTPPTHIPTPPLPPTCPPLPPTHPTKLKYTAHLCQQLSMSTSQLGVLPRTSRWKMSTP